MSALNSALHVPQGIAYGGVSLSLDGNTVVFQGNSGSNQSNVYIYNRLTDTVSLLMPSGGNAHIDGSGRFIATEGHLQTLSSNGVDVMLVAQGGNIHADAPAKWLDQIPDGTDEWRRQPHGVVGSSKRQLGARSEHRYVASDRQQPELAIFLQSPARSTRSTTRCRPDSFITVLVPAPTR